MDQINKSKEFHKKHQGKIGIELKDKMDTPEDLSLFYTPGMAYICQEIVKDKNTANLYTAKGRSIAMVCDGTAVLGFGDIGPEAAIPVLEGKSAVYKRFANLDAIPLCIDKIGIEKTVEFCLALQPSYSGIHLEDIKSPECFYILKELQKKASVPVFHDDQHGTAVVVLAGLLNALKVTGRSIEETSIIINGAGAAGLATLEVLKEAGFKKLRILDSKGLICKERDDLNDFKKHALLYVEDSIFMNLEDAIKDTDVFIGLSVAKLVTKEFVRSMKKDPIIFALANPEPEIWPEEAIEAGAAVVATGRADYPNQVNNVVAFPGIFKGAIENKIKQFTNNMYVNAAKNLAAFVKNPSKDNIIPSIFEKGVVEAVSSAILEDC